MKFFKAALLGAILCPTLALAAPCSGPAPFADVAVGSNFCSFIEWMKNRAVTTGCGGANYCPGTAVTRDAMAKFMNVLADTILPAPTQVEAATGAMALTALYTDNRQCQSAPGAFPAVDYPRIFTVSTHLSVLSSAGTATIGVQPLYSLDGGTTWTAPNAQPETVGLDATFTGHVTDEATFQVPATKAVVVAQGVASVSGATGIAAGGRCHILVRQQSVTGSSSPYDVPPGVADVE